MKNDFGLGDKMKFFEEVETERYLSSELPIMMRLDGKNFHSFTRGLDRPYDARLSTIMLALTDVLVQFSNARMGYTQSDEITLLLYKNFEKENSQVFFNASVFKLTSVLASLASVQFYKFLLDELPEKSEESPVFDCRVWNVPSEEDAVDCFLWRQRDAIRNSIQMMGQCFLGHKIIQGKNTVEIKSMLDEKNIFWDTYPGFFRNGVFVQKRKVSEGFRADEIERLPALHEARKNPNLKVLRNTTVFMSDVPLGKVKNSVGFIFNGELPIVGADAVS